VSCHTPAPVPTATRATTGPGLVEPAVRVLLVGGPNVGKSTLFNALTGARQRTVNAPGTTVELATGTWRTRTLVDLPGTYSLLARSADEQVTADAVRGLAAAPGRGTERDVPDGAKSGVVVVVLDATAITRSLYLLAQVAETGVPLVVALTMLDVATDVHPTRGMRGSLAAALSHALGVPVVAVDARDRAPGSLDSLASAVDEAAVNPQQVIGIGAAGAADDLADSGAADDLADSRANGTDHLGPDAGRTAPGLVDDLAHADVLFAWVEKVAALVLGGDAQAGPESDPAARTIRRTFSDRVDAVLLNPWAGIPVFLAVVWLLFELTTRFAAPLMAVINRLITGPVAAGITWLLGLAGLDHGWLRGLLVDGVLAGVGTVLTFLPVMAVMFLALGILEDSGYLARAAFVADRAMRSLGLDGRALLPLVVGFGCNLPALAATRTLPNARQRLLTGLLIPLTSCSARLTVYVLLAGAFFPHDAGTVIFALYLTSVLLVLGGGLLLRRTIFRDVRPEPLVLVLPAYQRPHLRSLGLSVRLRVGAFVVGAGKVIVATMLVIWLLMAVPAVGQHGVGDVPVGDSLYDRAANGLAPALAPAGFGNAHAAAALITGFVAKEVVVGSFAQSFAVDASGDPHGDLATRLRASFDESSGGHGPAAALAFMVLVLAYTPCVATLAEQRRLFGWRPTAGAVGAQLAVAWLLAVLVFQVGSRL
jgi:ferrous iron transport protein B